MNFLLDTNPLEELYKLAHLPDLPEGFDPLGPFKGKHARIIVLQETIDEVRTKHKHTILEAWLKANGATIHQQFKEDGAFESVRDKFARRPRQTVKPGQRSDIAAFAFLHDKRHDRQHYAMVGRDADWADYRSTVKPEFVNPNHTSYAGLSQIYVQEVLNGRMTTAQLAGIFDHLSAHDLSDRYGLRLSEIKDRLKAEANSKMGRKKPERVEKLKLELLRGYIEKARKASRLEGGKRNDHHPLYWILHRDLPSPEDYVLQRSGFEPGHVRRQLKAANRFVKTNEPLMPRYRAAVPIPTPRPVKPTLRTGPVPVPRPRP